MDALIAALQRPEAYDHPVGAIRLLETHISWVLLTGRFAYKIKKPVNLGFVDFHSLELRHQACREEIRLNRRLAPELYREVVAIHGPVQQARVGGGGPVIEWAVRMLEFPQDALLPEALARDEVDAEAFEALADQLARFHDQAAEAAPDTAWGTPPLVAEPALANLRVLATCDAAAAQLEPLRIWTERTHADLIPVFEQRRRDGRIRECHGDLHLGNMALLAGGITVFDAIEFSPALRWIDVLSDMAFLVMDLQRRQRPDLGVGVLNRWLGRSGDYPGLATWRWYLTYRALVRAKVAALRLAQAGLPPPERRERERELIAYLQLAGRSSAEGCQPPTLAITHGVSGSGKSHLARRLCRRLGWIHLRSDVERKRRFGLSLDTPTKAPVPGLYDPVVSDQLYRRRLPDCAAAVLGAGLSLIVDATFLSSGHRQVMRELARQLGCRFLILTFDPDPDLARSRIDARNRSGRDPSDADATILEAQLQGWVAVTPAEADQLIHVPAAIADSDDALAALAARLAPQNQ